MSGGLSLARSVSASGKERYSLGHPLVDRYLEFVGGRSRPNTLRAVAFDLKAFFAVVAKDPLEVSPVDVFEFLAHQHGDRSVVRLSDRESGLAARTIARRLSSVSGLYSYLVARGDTVVRANPVPRGLSTRCEGGAKKSRSVPLVRVPRTLPTVLGPSEVDRLVSALRTHRDQAMVTAMVLVGLRRCEVLGLRLGDIWAGERKVFVAEGKGGHQRVVPASGRFFAAVGGYLHDERPKGLATDKVFVVLKGHGHLHHRGRRPHQPRPAGGARPGLRGTWGPVSTRASTAKVSYNWHLRMRMAERGMFATSDLVPLLAERGVVLSREQVYRLVAKVPERVSLTVLAALCDALGVSPSELVEPVRAGPGPRQPRRPGEQCRASVPAGPGWCRRSDPRAPPGLEGPGLSPRGRSGRGAQRRPGQLGHRRRSTGREGPVGAGQSARARPGCPARRGTAGDRQAGRRTAGQRVRPTRAGLRPLWALPPQAHSF